MLVDRVMEPSMPACEITDASFSSDLASKAMCEILSLFKSVDSSCDLIMEILPTRIGRFFSFNDCISLTIALSLETFVLYTFNERSVLISGACVGMLTECRPYTCSSSSDTVIMVPDIPEHLL